MPREEWKKILSLYYAIATFRFEINKPEYD